MTLSSRLLPWVGVATAVLLSGALLAAEPGDRAAPSGETATPAPSGESPAPEGAPAQGDGDKAAKKAPSSAGGYSWTDKSGKRTARRARPLPRHAAGAAVVTYPGFRMLQDGSSMVWVTLSRRVPFQVQAAGSVVTVRLPGAYVDVRNNTNPLLTEHFPTPVKRVRLRPDKDGVSLIVELRQAQVAQHRLVEGAGGAIALELSFAPGQSTTRDASASGPALSVQSGTPPSSPSPKARRTGSRAR